MTLIVRVLAFFLILIFFNSTPASVAAQSPVLLTSPRISADAAVLIDASTGQVLYGKNEMRRMHPASVTKIMTVLLAFETARLDDVVTVSRRAASWNAGSTAGLRTDDRLTMENLLRAAALMSANDATIAIAEHCAGNYETFIQWMNLKAQWLGAHRTRFANTHGWTHPNHYTTAYDLALITRWALHNPRFAQLVSTRRATISWEGSNRKEEINNTNRLLHSDYPGINGVKTGTTSAAGHCLVASATRDHRQLIAVVLHCGNRYQDAAKILDYGFAMEPVTVCVQGEEICRVKVRGGTSKSVGVTAKRNLDCYLPYDRARDVERHMILPPEVQTPVVKGQRLGEVAFTLRGQELGRVPLVAAQAVGKQTWLLRLLDKLQGES